MNNTILVVENGINTSYIDSLLFALFYKESHIQNILYQQTDKNIFMYLQDMIHNNFVYPIRSGFSISSSILNEIRNYSYLCGWKNNCNILDLYNVSEYFEFIMNGFSKNLINIDIMEINHKTNTQMMKSIECNFIELTITENNDIKYLLKDWENNITPNKNIYYNFKEVPMTLPIYLNRFTKASTNFSKIDIKRKLKFYKNKDDKQLNFYWNIHSVICFSNSGSGSYYSLINMGNNNWYIFTK